MARGGLSGEGWQQAAQSGRFPLYPVTLCLCYCVGNAGGRTIHSGFPGSALPSLGMSWGCTLILVCLLPKTEV